MTAKITLKFQVIKAKQTASTVMQYHYTFTNHLHYFIQLCIITTKWQKMC